VDEQQCSSNEAKGVEVKRFAHNYLFSQKVPPVPCSMLVGTENKRNFQKRRKGKGKTTVKRFCLTSSSTMVRCQCVHSAQCINNVFLRLTPHQAHPQDILQARVAIKTTAVVVFEPISTNENVCYLSESFDSQKGTKKTKKTSLLLTFTYLFNYAFSFSFSFSFSSRI
jgi:hypothetical protein